MNISIDIQSIPPAITMTIVGVSIITDTYSNWFRTINIYFNSESEDSVNRLLSTNEFVCPYLTIKTEFDSHYIQSDDILLKSKQTSTEPNPFIESKFQLFVYRCLNKKQLLNILMQFSDDFHESHFILIVFFEMDNIWSERDAQNILEFLWDTYRYSRVAVMQYRKTISIKEELFLMEIHTFIPYLQHHKCETWQWNNNELLGSSFKGIFKDKTDNMFGRPFRMRISMDYLNNYHMIEESSAQMKMSGSIVMYGHLLMEKMNGSLQLVVPLLFEMNIFDEHTQNLFAKMAVPVTVIPWFYRRLPNLHTEYITSTNDNM